MSYFLHLLLLVRIDMVFKDWTNVSHFPFWRSNWLLTQFLINTYPFALGHLFWNKCTHFPKCTILIELLKASVQSCSFRQDNGYYRSTQNGKLL